MNSPKRSQSKPQNKNNSTNNNNAEAKLSVVYSTAVPKPKGFSYAHVWSGKPRAQQQHVSLSVAGSPNTNNKSRSNADGSASSPSARGDSHMTPQTRKRLIAARKEEMNAVREELAPQLDGVNPALAGKLGSLLEEEPRTQRAAALQKQILQLLRQDERLRESILQPEPDEEDDGEDISDHDESDAANDDGDEANKSGNEGRNNRKRSGSSSSSSSSVSTVSGRRKQRKSNQQRSASSDSSSSNDSTHRHRSQQDTRTAEEKQREKLQQLLQEGKHVLQKDLRPRKPDAKQGTKTVFHPDINKGMRFNHGNSKLHPYRVMTLPWNKARALPPKSLIEEEEKKENSSSKQQQTQQNQKQQDDARANNSSRASSTASSTNVATNDHQSKPKETKATKTNNNNNQHQKYVVVDDATLDSFEVKDLHFKQARAFRTKLEYNERLERREIFGQMLSGFDVMRSTAKRQKEELLLRVANAKGEVPVGSRPISIRQKMYQSLLGEKRSFPPPVKEKEKRQDDTLIEENALRLCFINTVRMGDNFMDNFITIEGVVVPSGANTNKNNNNNNNPSSSSPMKKPKSGMVVDPQIITSLELRPCLVAGKVISNTNQLQENDANTNNNNNNFSPKRKNNQNNNNNGNDKSASPITTSHASSLELVAVDRDDPSGRILGRAAIPSSVFTKPTSDEVPLLQVDVPIYSTDQNDEVANCELICEALKLFQNTGVGYLKKVLVEEGNEKKKGKREKSSDKKASNNNNNKKKSPESSASSSPASALSSPSSNPNSNASSPSKNSDVDNNNKSNNKKSSAKTSKPVTVHRYKVPSHCLVECSLIDESTANLAQIERDPVSKKSKEAANDDSPASDDTGSSKQRRRRQNEVAMYTPVAAVRRSHRSDRALPLRSVNSSSTCTLLVTIPKYGTGNGGLNLMRFDVGLFPNEMAKKLKKEKEEARNRSENRQETLQKRGSSKIDLTNTSTSSTNPDNNNNANGNDVYSHHSEGDEENDDEDEEPEVVTIDFDLFSILANSINNCSPSKNNNNTNNNNQEGVCGGELATAVDVPITESISIRLHFTFLGDEIEVDIPCGDAGSDPQEIQNEQEDGVPTNTTSDSHPNNNINDQQDKHHDEAAPQQTPKRAQEEVEGEL